MKCPTCGHELLEPVVSNYCTNCGKEIPAWLRESYYFVPQVPQEPKNGLTHLKNAFLLYLTGGILAFVPIVGTAGAAMYLVGAIFLILSWRALGRSNLPGAPNYRSTGRWLVNAIIIAVVIGIVGTAVVTAFLVSYLISTGVPHVPASQARQINPFQFTWFRTFLYELLGVTMVAFLVWASAWVKMCNSMKRLAKEISQPRIGTAGNFYILQLIIGFVVSAIFIFFLDSGALLFPMTSTIQMSALYGSYYGMLLLGGFWTVLGALGIASTVIVVVGSYIGYDGVRKALGSLGAQTSHPTSLPAPPG